MSFFLFILTVTSSKPSKPVSSDLIAFCNDSGNDLPIAMTSPTDFIELDSKGCVNWNFSKVNLGIFVTT